MSQEKCIPCNSKSVILNKMETDRLLGNVPEYKLLEIDNEKRISRKYTFKNFKEALAFTNSVGEISEQQKHHPRIILEWGNVEVSWWTHSIGGLHKNDFIMALETDRLYKIKTI